MRILLSCFLITAALWGGPNELTSFHAKFEQSIVDEKGKTLRYQGELWASKPQNALWVYQKPVQKSVYINGQKLTVIEPQIEQVTLRTLGNEIDFLGIIKKAKKIGENRYAATVNSQDYLVEFKNNILSSISYKDAYDNAVTLRFINPAQNIAIEPSRFQPRIPVDYDVIKD